MTSKRDSFERYAAAVSAQFQRADGRSPDTLDAAQTIQPVEIVHRRGFEWATQESAPASEAR